MKTVFGKVLVLSSLIMAASSFSANVWACGGVYNVSPGSTPPKGSTIVPSSSQTNPNAGSANQLRPCNQGETPALGVCQ